MCGICFTVKQSFLWRRQRRNSPGAACCCGGGGGEASSGNSHHHHHPSLSGRPSPTQSGPPAGAPNATALEERGIIEGFTVTPCPAADGLAMRVVTLRDSRRQYTAPTAAELAGLHGSALFMRVLDNIRRRGPETFGATRRVIDGGCLLARGVPAPLRPSPPATVVAAAPAGKAKRGREPSEENANDAGDDEPTTTTTTTATAAVAIATVSATASAMKKTHEAAKQPRTEGSTTAAGSGVATAVGVKGPAGEPPTTTTTTAESSTSSATGETPRAHGGDDSDGADDEEEHLLMRTELQGISAVLGLRGHATVHQPFEMEVETDLEEDDEGAGKPVNKSFLLWNGEIFNGPMCPPPWGSDTVVLASRLSQLEQECVPTSDADPMNLLSLRARQQLFLARCVQAFEEEVQGPYGFLFYANQLQLAIFGRDPLGRHSLLAHISIYHQQQQGNAGNERPVMEVELIVSSVGVQHATKLDAHSATAIPQKKPAAVKSSGGGSSGGGGGDGDRKRPRPAAGDSDTPQQLDATRDPDPAVAAGGTMGSGDGSVTVAPAPAPGSAKSPAAPPADAVERTAAPSAAAATPKATASERRKANKKIKTEDGAAAPAVGHEDDEDGGSGGVRVTAGGGASGAAAVEEDESLHGCWAELPVTGLFAVPLDRPLVSGEVLLAASNRSSEPSKTAATADTDGGCEHRQTLRLDGAGVGPAEARGLLMHCPWRDRYHLVHPLLRAFVAAAEEDRANGGGGNNGNSAADTPLAFGPPPSPHSSGNGLAPGHHHHNHPLTGSPTNAKIPLPFGLPSAWAPPKRPLLFSTEDTVPALPPLLAGRIGALAPPPGASDDAVWAHWAATCYLHALSAAVMRRTDVAAAGAEDSRDWATFSKALSRPLCVLFSGGIDCTVLAALAHYLVPLETPIELVNVAFGPAPGQAPDRIATLRAVEELVRLSQPAPHPDSLAAAASLGVPAASEREWRLVLVDVPGKLSAETAHILDLVTPRHTVMDLDIGTALWYAARGVGRMQVLRRSDLVEEEGGKAGTAPPPPQPPAQQQQSSLSSPSAASLLQGFNKHLRVADAVLDPTTTTVAGEGASYHGSPTPAPTAPTAAAEDKFQMLIEVLVAEGRQGDGPARPVLLSTLGKEYAEFLRPHLATHGYKKMGAFLNDACKAGLIRFEAAASSKAVLLAREEDRRRAAPPPPCRWYRTPEMVRRQQQQQPPPETIKATDEEEGLMPPVGTYDLSYVSKAKVLLVGMGADETLGGYTRYRRYYGRHGMLGTRQELEKDFARLWMRNLGRDDRITMDSGREPRFPFLDEELLMTLEKIVAERRRALLAAGGPFSSTVPAAPARDVSSDDGVGTAANSTGTPRRPPSPSTSAAAPAPTGDAPTPQSAADAEAAVLQTSLEPIMSFRLGPGEGDKRVLRGVAAMVGLDTVTRLQKRAIQFGTRVADRRVSGSTEL